MVGSRIRWPKVRFIIPKVRPRIRPARTSHFLPSFQGQAGGLWNVGMSRTTDLPSEQRSRAEAAREKKGCEMRIVVNDRDRTSGISKQTPYRGTRETNQWPVAVGVRVLPPDRRQGIFTVDWGRSCRWEVRTAARGRRRGGGGGGTLTGRHLDSSALQRSTRPSTWIRTAGVDRFLQKKNDHWDAGVPVFLPFRCCPCL